MSDAEGNADELKESFKPKSFIREQVQEHHRSLRHSDAQDDETPLSKEPYEHNHDLGHSNMDED